MTPLLRAGRSAGRRERFQGRPPGRDGAVRIAQEDAQVVYITQGRDGGGRDLRRDDGELPQQSVAALDRNLSHDLIVRYGELFGTAFEDLEKKLQRFPSAASQTSDEQDLLHVGVWRMDGM